VLWNVRRGLLFITGWAIQLTFAYFCPLVVVVILSVLLSAPDSVMWQFLDYLIFGLVSLVLALSVSQLFPGSTAEGRWIWTMPVGLLVCGVLWDMTLGRLDSALTALVGTGEVGWVKVLITLPAWGCCWYSATMAWRRRRQARALAGKRE